ncbi:MAG: ABC transporter ATP-binding protein [Clostridia bacterium]|nr:ABC transporter ATP-binding protein [Clostridia bacterium]
MAEILLDIKDLVVEYKSELETVHAVNGINLRLNKRETLGIVGETGAGKTTTALSILRLLPDRVGHIAGGSVEFEGRDLLTLPESEMRAIRGEKISMIFQDPMTALDPIMTVGDQIKEALELHNHDNKSAEQIDRRVDEVLEMVGIPAYRRTEYPHQFSGGMKQRVVIAIALSCEPDLLIADEPTTALDVTIQAQVLSLMRRLKNDLDTSMLLITHDLGIVAQTCDTVAVMYAGYIIESGTIDDIFTGERHHPYTVGLFGSIPNLTVRAERLTPIDGLMPDPTKLPAGCPFAPRCPECRAECERGMPPVSEMSETHRICCWKYSSAEQKGDDGK